MATLLHMDESHAPGGHYHSRYLIQVLEPFILIGSTTFPKRLDTAHMDVMKVVYQPPLHIFHCKSIRQCILQ